VHPKECRVAFSSCFLRAHDEGAEGEQQKYGSTNLNAKKKRNQQLLGKCNILRTTYTITKIYFWTASDSMPGNIEYGIF
jgi:hypothetical protein